MDMPKRKSPRHHPVLPHTGAGVHQITDRSLSRPPCFALDLRREYGPRRPEKVKWFPDTKTARPS